MRPLRYSINVTLDGCCDHRAVIADEDLHRHGVENLDQADALLLGRVTYEMMEAAWRSPRTDAMPEWTEPVARSIDAAKKYVVSSTLDRVDWNAELVRGDLGTAVQQLKRESGKGLLTGGVTLPRPQTHRWSGPRLLRAMARCGNCHQPRIRAGNGSVKTMRCAIR
jgi:hypothetical protein